MHKRHRQLYRLHPDDPVLQHPSRPSFNYRLLSYVVGHITYRVIFLLLATTARVARIFYLRKRDVNRFLRSNASVSRTNYFRLLAIASLEILFTLPFGIVSLTLKLTSASEQEGSFPVYPGWSVLHEDWDPVTVSYAQLQSFGTFTMAASYFTIWTSPALTFVIFAFFGLNSEARASYRRLIVTIGNWVGWKPTRVRNAQSTLGTIEFGAGPQELSTDAETGYVSTSTFLDRSDISSQLASERSFHDGLG